MTHTHQPLFALCLCGPTGAGKTFASLTLANAFNGAVINADSRQIYEDFPIITAQPSATELANCPHHLFAFAKTTETLNAGTYARMATEKALTLHKQGYVPIFVGGTGLYIKTLFNGIAPIPAIPEDIRLAVLERYEQEGGLSLYNELAKIDAQYATKIHPNDKQRVARGLEVYRATGKSLSWWHAQGSAHPPFKPLILSVDMPLDTLEPRLAKRIDLMLAEGAIAEAQNALTKCEDKKAPGWSGIGCQELFDYLAHNISLEECRRLWLKNTRAYAKRQRTWFRTQPNMHRFSPEDITGMMNLAKKYL